jgi:hypothetical protein
LVLLARLRRRRIRSLKGAKKRPSLFRQEVPIMKALHVEAKFRKPFWVYEIFLGIGLMDLSGCGSDSGMPGSSRFNPPPTAPPPPPPGLNVSDGRYVGTVTIDGVDYFGDAIFAANGETHLYIGGPYDGGGNIQLDSPEGSIDFVGSDGSGRVIGREGEDCGEAGSPSVRWCGRASSARLSAEPTAGSENGSIHGEITGHDETWTFSLTPWSNYYNQPADLGALAGQYNEEVAPFARNGMVLTIDEDGRAFFQAGYLCTGNGTIAPLGDGEVNVFTVEMSISNCDYPYIQYNGDYEGLATISPSDYWAYDANVRIWLASFSPDASAVTLWGRSIPDD